MHYQQREADMSIQKLIMEKRKAAGLRLAFIIPDRPDVFVCYPATPSHKAEWLAKADKRGWTLAEPSK
jgi:hypothetical protein